MWSAWSRSIAPSGSIVMNGSSVRSRSGSRGLAAAASAAASTSGEKSPGSSSSARIRAMPSCSVFATDSSSPPLIRTTWLLGMRQTLRCCLC